MAKPNGVHDQGMDSDDELECSGEWNLGFVEPPRRATDVLRHRFPSKVGGRPAWLDPLHLPTPEQLKCGVTGRTMEFLLQVYAPVDDNPGAFHRTIFLFTSPQGDKLAQPGAVRAFRCQMPRQNSFYSSDPPGKGNRLPPLLVGEDASAALARDPWRVAEHEQQQKQGSGGVASSSGAAGSSGEGAGAVATEQQQRQQQGAARRMAVPRLFPELELLVEPEEEDGGEGEGGDPQLRQLVQQYKARTAVECEYAVKDLPSNMEGEYTEEELPSDVVDSIEANVTEEQRHFAAFSARVAREPSQCLRYCFEPGASPLWPSCKNVPGPGDVPPCDRCGAERRFEFQVMPQLLNYLDLDPSDPSSPDWGIIAVYSCSASCGGGGEAGEGGSAYQEEFVWVQPS